MTTADQSQLTSHHPATASVTGSPAAAWRALTSCTTLRGGGWLNTPSSSSSIHSADSVVLNWREAVATHEQSLYTTPLPLPLPAHTPLHHP